MTEDAQLLLAVPNISEGRDRKLVERIAGTACLLDLHCDADHNRSVLTYGGVPSELADALYGMVDRAVSTLDITRHEGVHPRFGVVDIIPVIPYRSTDSMAVALVTDLSWRIAQGPGIRVHTYGRASREERTLPQLRRALRESTEVTHPTAGVICMGVRDPLIAFNVNIEAPLVDAQTIAGFIRSPHVRALGFPLSSRHLSQVSMNLVDPLAVGPLEVFERIERLTDAIVDAEVVGLVPDEVVRQFLSIPLTAPAWGIAASLARAGRG